MRIRLFQSMRDMDLAWKKLLDAARAKVNPRQVSAFVDVGGAAAAILTENGNIYTGICIDTACSLGMCAERNAAANMLTNGESGIAKIVCVGSNGKPMPPCGVCREFLLQLAPAHAELEFLISGGRVVKLGDLLPDWWGEKKETKE